MDVKKILFFFVLILVGAMWNNVHGDETIEGSTNVVSIKVGDTDDLTKIPVTVYLNNPGVNITCVEVNMEAPVAVTKWDGYYDEDEEAYVWNYDKGTRWKSNHTPTITPGTRTHGENALFIHISSSTTQSFRDEEGAIITICFDGSELADGSYSVRMFDSFSVWSDKVTNITYTSPEMDAEFTIAGGKVIAGESSYILGDINGDGGVSVTDAVAIVNIILGNDAEGLSREAADINKDGEITVTDAVGVVNLILNGAGSSASSKSFAEGVENDLLSIGDVIAEDNNNVRVMIKSPEGDFTASQFDIVLPEGIELEDIEPADRRHSVSYTEDNGVVRVVCYSLNNDEFRGGDIVELKLRATGEVDAIDFSSIELTRPDLSNVSARSQSLNTEGLTRVNGIDSTSAIASVIYDLNGRKMKNATRKGTYIINGKKVKL